jgi:hypothetical protein
LTTITFFFLSVILGLIASFECVSWAFGESWLLGNLKLSRYFEDKELMPLIIMFIFNLFFVYLFYAVSKKEVNYWNYGAVVLGFISAVVLFLFWARR